MVPAVVELVRELSTAPGPREARARARRAAVDADHARQLLEWFNGLLLTGRIGSDEMFGAVRAAMAIAEVDGTEFSRAVALRVRGLVRHLDGRSVVATGELERAARRFDRAGERLAAGDVYRALIDVAMLAGDYTLAQKAASRAERRYRTRAAGPRRRGALAMNRGNLDHRLDRLDSALERYAEARRHYVRTGNPLLVAHADYNRANVLCSLDRTRDARRLYERARDAYSAARSPLAIQADYALAGVDLLEGRLDPCLQRLESVERRHAEVSDHAGVAHAKLERAEALLRLNRSREAEQVAKEARAWFRQRNFDAEEIACCGVLAERPCCM